MLDEKKVFKDNVLGYINVDRQIIWDLINTPEFQRLRRIRHLGGVSMVFHTAEHSRFTHSLGVYEITRRMIGSIEGLKLTEYEIDLLLCSALLHDVGHGPFSHAFETVSEFNHEKMTARIVRESPKINEILVKYNASLVEDICKVLNHTYENELITSLISSQIDADRLDYMVRDSYNSGVVYGITDLERLFRIAKIVDNKVCFKIKAIKELEIYLLSRVCMYENIYFHPNGRSYELIFQNTLKRYNYLKGINHKFNYNYTLLDKISPDMSYRDFLLLDDSSVIHYMKCFIDEDDEVLSDLGRRFINRDLFKFSSYYQEGEIFPTLDDVNVIAEESGFDYQYYVATDTLTTKFYRFDEAIYVCDEDKIYELDDVSDVVAKISADTIDTYIYYPVELEEEITKILKG